MSTNSTVTSLAAASLACMCAWVVAITGAHLRPTGYNFAQNAVSDFGSHPASRPFAWAQWGLMASAAALLTAAGFELLAANGLDDSAPHLGEGLNALAVFAGARALIPFFPNLVRVNPPPGQERNDVTVFLTLVHVVLALVAFVAIPIAAVSLGIGFSNTDQLAGLPVYGNALLGLGWFVAAGLIVMVLTIWMRRLEGPNLFGLGERVLYLAIAMWLFAFGALLVQT